MSNSAEIRHESMGYIWFPKKLAEMSKYMKILLLFCVPALVISSCTKYQIENNCCEGNWHITTQNFNRPTSFGLRVPQAFTPNGDGVNDQFFPLGKGWDLEKLVIKKGLRTVYESTDRLDAFWDGGEEKDGQYRYFMTFKTTTGDLFEANGRVCLMRYGERGGRYYDVQRDKVCDCLMMDMMDSTGVLIRQTSECPSNAGVPLNDPGDTQNDTI